MIGSFIEINGSVYNKIKKHILFISKSDCKKKESKDKTNKITPRLVAERDRPPWELYFLHFGSAE